MQAGTARGWAKLHTPASFLGVSGACAATRTSVSSESVVKPRCLALSGAPGALSEVLGWKLSASLGLCSFQ